MTELEDLAQQVRLLRAGDTTGEPQDAHDPLAIHVGDAAGGDLTGFYPNPTLAVPASALPTTRPVTFDPIVRNTDGLALSSFNGSGFAQDYTFTDTDGTVYVLFYNSEASPWIAKKGLADSDWTTFDLSSVNSVGTPTGIANTTGNPLSAPVTLDGHCFSTFGLDAAGRIHVSGNMHAQPLNYMRSTNPNDVSAWSGNLGSGTGGMAGTPANTGNITYPMFQRLPDRTLIFLYRTGASGDGDTHCSRWNGTDWDDLGQITDGTTDGVSAYLQPPCIDSNGDMHLIYNWRTSGAADTNVGWYYVKLTGLQGSGTMAAAKWDGTAVTLPLRIGTSGHIGETIADFPLPYVINDAAPGNMQPCDKDGYPHTCFMAIDTIGNPQMFHAYRDAAGWKCDQITTWGGWSDHTHDSSASWTAPTTPPTTIPQFTGSNLAAATYNGANWHASTPAGDASRWKIISTPDGKTLAIGYWPGEGLRGALWCRDISPGQPGYAVNTHATSPPAHDDGAGNSGVTGFWLKQNPYIRLHDFADQGDFHYDYNAVASGLLRILITASSQRFYHDPGIFSQYPALMSPQPNQTDVPGGANWATIWGSPNLENPRGVLGLLTIDLTQLDLFKNGAVRLPTIRMVTESSGGNIPVPKNTSNFTPAGDLLTMVRQSSYVAVSSGGAATTHVATFALDAASGFSQGNDGSGNQPSIVIPSTVSGGMLFGRMFVQMRSVNGGGYISCCMVEAVAMDLSPSHAQTVNGGTYNIGACWNDVSLGSNVTQSAYNDSTIFTTPWIRLRHFDTLGAGNVGRLRLSCRTGGAAATKGTITSVTIQLGVLDAL